MDEILAQALSKEVDERFQRVDEFAEAMTRALDRTMISVNSLADEISQAVTLPGAQKDERPPEPMERQLTEPDGKDLAAPADELPTAPVELSAVSLPPFQPRAPGSISGLSTTRSPPVSPVQETATVELGTAELETGSISVPPGQGEGWPAAAPLQGDQSSSSLYAAWEQPEEPSQNRARSRVWLGLAALAVVTIAAVAYSLAPMDWTERAASPMTSLSSSAAPASSPEQPHVAPPASPPPAGVITPAGPPTVKVILELEPAGARWSLDGKAQTDNPMVLDRSDQEHILTVQSAGYVPQKQSFRPESDRRLKISLQPLAPAKRKAPARAARSRSRTRKAVRRPRRPSSRGDKPKPKPKASKELYDDLVVVL